MPAKIHLTNVVNGPGPAESANRAFNVVLVPKGATHGLGDALINEKEDPLVEFYDATYQGDPRFPIFGQFIGAYNRRTLLDAAAFILSGRAPHGLDLQGGVGAWKLDAPAYCHVLAQLVRSV